MAAAYRCSACGEPATLNVDIGIVVPECECRAGILAEAVADLAGQGGMT